MATSSASTERLETLLQCPICLNVLDNPKVFPCLHFFCKNCIDDMKPKQLGNQTGYECSICREFSPTERLRAMHFVHELLEVVALAKSEQKPCEKCKTEKPTHRCLDCKENFCGTCKEHHDGFKILQHHIWEELSPNTEAKLDKLVYCTKHRGKLIELNCKDCNELICLICKGVEHNNHQAETIDDALVEKVSVVQKQSKDMTKLLQETEMALVNTDKKAKEIEQNYDQLEREINQREQSILQKIKEDAKVTKQNLQDIKTKQMTEIEEFRNSLILKQKAQKTIVELNDSTLSKAQGISLLQALQTGVSDSMASYLEQHTAVAGYDGDIRATLSDQHVPTESLLGDVSEKEIKQVFNRDTAVKSTQPTRWIDQNMSDIMKQRTTLIKEIKVSDIMSRFARIGNELWCTYYGNHTIHVLSLQGEQIKILSTDGVGQCRSVIETAFGIVLASSTGLHIIDTKGTVICKITDGDFCDASSINDRLYAINISTANVRCFKYDSCNKRHVKMKDLKIPETLDNYFSSMQVTPTHIYLANCSKQCIYKIDIGTSHVMTYGSPGVANNQPKSPILCGVDKDDNILISDMNNDRLSILLPGGNFDVMNVAGLKQPAYVSVAGGVLFVAQLNGRLKQYKFN